MTPQNPTIFMLDTLRVAEATFRKGSKIQHCQEFVFVLAGISKIESREKAFSYSDGFMAIYERTGFIVCTYMYASDI